MRMPGYCTGRVERVNIFERDGEWEVTTTRQRVTAIVEFTDEEEGLWLDAMCGEWEEQ